ncbi:MAG: glutathione peroxidase [Bacteroidota bacterium]|nr:glutathione peroxidase [Bacteroidota bacterium]
MINKAKSILGFFTLAGLLNLMCKPAPPNDVTTEKDFYKIKINSIEGDAINLSAYKGKKILCVNVASYCGYTPQYQGLEQLYNKYKGKLVIIGFPCNQFGGQEPDSLPKIKQFCSSTYQISFPLTEKVDVKGKKQHPIYQWLTEKNLNGVEDHEVKWNFNKFLLDENGKFLGYFSSKTSPSDSALISMIEK